MGDHQRAAFGGRGADRWRTGPAAGPWLRLTLLGAVRGWRSDRELELGPARQRAVLAVLALRANLVVSQQELLDAVWGMEPPGTGGKVVPVYVHRLRKKLRDGEDDGADAVIGRDSGGYRFLGNAAELDTTVLEERTADADAADRAGDLAAATRLRTDALALFEGEPLAGLPGPFVAGQRQRLLERRTALLLAKVDGQLRMGQYDETVSDLTALVETEPHHETVAALLMRALAGAGRRADALAVFGRLRRRLVDDLGVEPGAAAQQTHQAVLRDDAYPGRNERASPSVSPARTTASTSLALPGNRPRNELPADIGELIGRDGELAAVVSPGQDTVTVTVVDGLAGAGKTTLAIRAAHLLSVQYPDGCLFVDLHGHAQSRTPRHPRRVLRRLLRAVGTATEHLPDDLDELTAHWRAATAPLRLLLILDDAAGTDQVRGLLPTGPGSRVLVTTRRRLPGLGGEAQVSLAGLPPEQAEGLLERLIGTDRARDEPAATRELAELCGHLPLGLRIAGARLRNRPSWSVAYLAGRLTDDEHRLGELADADNSVEAAFRLSYEQLPAAERRAFRALGLVPTVEFDGLPVAAILGCAVPEAERLLEHLVDTSLLWQPAAGRYRVHDLVRVYARRLAGHAPSEDVAARTELLRLYLAAARCASDWGVSDSPTGPTLGTVPFHGWAEAASWLDAVGSELVDVVAYAADSGDVDHACWIAEGMVEYLTRQGRYDECRAALEIALPLVDRATDGRMASALRSGYGIAQGMQGRYAQARPWFTTALAISHRTGDLRERARARNGLGLLAQVEGRPAEALDHLTEALELAERLEDDWLTGLGVATLGRIQHYQGRHEQALDHLTRGVALARKLDNPRAIAMATAGLAEVQLDMELPVQAEPGLRQAVELAEQVGDIPLQAHCLALLGSTEAALGHLPEACRLHRRALATLTEHTKVQLELELRVRFGRSLIDGGDLAAARRQFELVQARGFGNEQLEVAVLVDHAADGLRQCDLIDHRTDSHQNPL